MKQCPQCQTEYEDRYDFCLKDGTPLLVAQAETSTISSPTAPTALPSPQNNALLFVLLAIALVAVGLVVYLLASVNHSPQQAPQALSDAQPVSSAPIVDDSTIPPSARRPAGAQRMATCYYNGVNVRSEPNREATLLIIIDIGQKMWVFRESNNYETNYLRSAGRDITDNWSEVELTDSGVRGWVWSAFLKQ
jgi:hypothetical protein